MEISVNRNRSSLRKIMITKADKCGYDCKFQGDKFTLEQKPGESMKDRAPVPITFVGNITEKGEEESLITGKFNNGFFLSKLVWVAVALIVTRLIVSILQKQLNNIVLCGIVTVLLIIVYVVTAVKGKPLKKEMTDYLNDLDVKH